MALPIDAARTMITETKTHLTGLTHPQQYSEFA